ncbi:PREDICTED: uncharacterized protein LOC109476670 [Branchiostoma belcheri]|uniref:Uncharacterized protein LOC109476670 n=1 Tax=Branchiostoma belcheri TaxID=7741 RepID=A0A6P4YV45_BRABE|nr:PREDICTED: uncharacterized protein LOC109476670 [Branchiostoma belcheri]KAI8511933.1 hypothetical protein Bbelb_110330 [Branchiostoma belcheri]
MSNFSARNFYRSGVRNGRSESTPRSSNSQNERTPQRTAEGTPVDPFRTPPGSEVVSNEKIYRALINLSREMKEQDRKHSEEMHVMQTKVSELTEEVLDLRQRLEARAAGDGDGAQQDGRRRKRAKSTQLSEMVRRLHNSDENEKKFDGKEGLNSPHNATVTSHLVKELAASGEYPPNAIRDACVGYYETIRRKFVNSLPENKEKALKHKKDKKQRSRRQRLMDARGTALQTDDERRLWTGVTVDLMSDEEDAVSNGIAVWLMKPPAFRSTQLSQLCGVLQTRLDTGGKHSDGRKPRIREEAAVSDRQPPESYDPDLAPLHFRPGHLPRPARRPGLATITNTVTNTPPHRPPAGRSLSFNDTDDTMSPRALEGYNQPSFVEGEDISDSENISLTPL